MFNKLHTRLAVAVTAAGLACIPAMAQSDKMSSKMSKDMMSKGMMSNDDKAMAYDKMTDAQKMSAHKKMGHDMAKMSSQEKMDMMSKMSVDDKAMAYDKMHPMKKHKM